MSNEENLIIINYIKKKTEELNNEVRLLERDGLIKDFRVTSGKEVVKDLLHSFEVLETNLVNEKLETEGFDGH
jgi:hypothetical protein